MKFILLIILSTLSLRYQVKAQNTPEITLLNYIQRAQLETDRMSSMLSLDSTRKDSVTTINKTYYLKIAQLKEQQLAITERSQQLTALENDWKERLRNVLTFSQFSQYFENKEALKRRLDSLRLLRNN